MAAPSYSQARHPSELISSFSVHTTCQYEKMVLSRDKDLFRDHLVSIKGYKAFYKHQTRDLSSTQINQYGQLVSFHGQNVSTGQGTVPSVEECRRHQETFNPPLYSGGPLAPRPPQKVPQFLLMSRDSFTKTVYSLRPRVMIPRRLTIGSLISVHTMMVRHLSQCLLSSETTGEHTLGSCPMHVTTHSVA